MDRGAWGAAVHGMTQSWTQRAAKQSRAHSCFTALCPFLLRLFTAVFCDITFSPLSSFLRGVLSSRSNGSTFYHRETGGFPVSNTSQQMVSVKAQTVNNAGFVDIQALLPSLSSAMVTQMKPWTAWNEWARLFANKLQMPVCTLSCFSHVWLFVTQWTVAQQPPLNKRFFRQQYWSGLPCSPPRDLPNPGTEPCISYCGQAL